MDTTNSVMSSVGRRKSPTKAKRFKAEHNKKKDPIKVVYISNPMKFSVAAAEFRALVQELTGQDAESLPDPSRFQDSGSDSVGGGGDQRDSNETIKDNENDGSTTTTCDGKQVEGMSCKDYEIGSGMEWFEAFDDVLITTTHISAFYQSSLLA